MDYSRIRIIEHPGLPADEVWIIHKSNTAQVPADLRGNPKVPFILTGNTSLAQRLISLVRTINGNGR